MVSVGSCSVVCEVEGKPSHSKRDYVPKDAHCVSYNIGKTQHSYNNVSLLFENEKKEIYVTCTERSKFWPK